MSIFLKCLDGKYPECQLSRQVVAGVAGAPVAGTAAKKGGSVPAAGSAQVADNGSTGTRAQAAGTRGNRHQGKPGKN